MTSKTHLYKLLVEKRKNFQYPTGLINPSQIENGKYDQINHLGPWSDWQGNLDAKIMVIGKDWGDVSTYIKQEGRDLDADKTNVNLNILFQEIGIEIGLPSQPSLEAPVFFTNAVLALREKGGKSGPLKQSWIKIDTDNFLEPLLKIINPQIILTLGMDAYKALAYIYYLKKDSLKNLVTSNPRILSDEKILFSLFHCGQLATSRIRNLELQKQDWKLINNYL